MLQHPRMWMSIIQVPTLIISGPDSLKVLKYPSPQSQCNTLIFIIVSFCNFIYLSNNLFDELLPL